MARIVHFGMSARGHLNPVIGVLQELDRRHELVVCNYERSAGHLAGYGLTTTTYESLFGADVPASPFERGPDEVARGVTMANPEGRREFFGALAAEVVANVERYRELLRDLRPDVVVHSLMFPGPRYAAESLGIPLVTSSASMATSPSAWLAPSDPAVAERIRNDFGVLRAATAPLHELRAELGLPGPGNPVDVFNVSRDAVLIYTSELFQGEYDGSRPYRFVGPCSRRSPVPATEPRAAGRRHVLVSLGTQADPGPALGFFRALAEAVDGMDLDVTVSVGRAVDPTAVDWPDNVRASAEVDQMRLLREVDAVVCQGGFNTVHEALAEGLPVWAMMMDNDHFQIGGRLHATGAGLATPFAAGADPATIRARIGTLLDSADLREGAARVRESFAAAGGSERAAREVAALAERSPAAPSASGR